MTQQHKSSDAADAVDAIDGAAQTSDTGEARADSGAASSDSLDAVIDTALRMFAADGFHDTKLEAIAKESGMSKRKIHYNFGDKKGLYTRATLRALERLTPPEHVLNRSYAVPVEGMRKFIDALYTAVKNNPDSAGILLREELDPVLDGTTSALTQRTDTVALHLERLLLIGQDSGAFRPGISADDVLVLLVSLSFFPTALGDVAEGLRNINFRSERNNTGLRRMVIDAVIAFLTTNISPSGYDSYLEPTPAADAADLPEVHTIADVSADYLDDPETRIY
ncbi:TetR/AcrR family transcriptional regulator [Corynebacterium hadale]|uniref:TetR/AcrR family transcriptional regulator n=1 Tax=Corynebacterium hadale TaxID=2026255 RepID=UPI000BAA6A41|nr:TetR/AcrR family transcriptional regulator [Corynebacterium hadale]PAT08358.1 TetR family transcriptional regulator [Corynebacterium hadale]